MYDEIYQFPIIRCKKCDKCCFIYLLLSAHLAPEYIQENIFSGINIFSDGTLTDKFLQLIGNKCILVSMSLHIYICMCMYVCMY